MDRLDSYANTVPTVVLVEVRNNSPEDESKTKSLFPLLHALSADIQGARFQKHVMPFAVLIGDDSHDDMILDSTITSYCLQAGAIDILHSPLQHEDVNRILGHIKDTVRPPARLIGAPMAQNLVDSIRNTSQPPKESCHRPDESLSPERRAAVESAVRQWYFPAQDFNMDELTYAALFMLEHVLSSSELEGFSLSRPQLMTFLLETRRQYKHEREVHYHNWRHAVDVAQSIFCFVLDVRLCPPLESDGRDNKRFHAIERMLRPVDALILLVSAIGHDVGHPGVNNAFLIACNHPLAQTYNDKSVLENYHCAAYSQLLRRHWPSLNNIPGFRAKMISTILATDMQRHFEYMGSLGELKAKVQSSEPVVDNWSDKDRDNSRELIMALLLKAADISNVARPFDISARWAKILMNEFARQGELESELQIPTCLFGGPPDKEDIMAAAQSQKGFMSLFGFPLFSGIAEIMPSVSCSIRELENNRNVWDQKIEEEQQRRKAGNGHVENDEEYRTFGGVSHEQVDEAEKDNHSNSEPGAVPAQSGQEPSTPTKRAATTGNESSPATNTASDLRQQLASGIAGEEDKRSSAPFLNSPGAPFSPTGGSSRRSSKDVALDQMQHTSAYAPPSLSPTPDSRRGSTDAGWQIHQSYPSSRRGSKDESLTTILVTSGGTPNRRSSPSSPGKMASPTPKPLSQRQIAQSNPKQNGPRNSVPSARSHAASTGTTSNTQYSPSTQPSTQPSSLTAAEDETTPPEHFSSIPSTEDPFMTPGNWPNDMVGRHRASVTEGLPPALPPTPPPPLGSTTKEESSRTVTRVASAETEEAAPTPSPQKGLREQRSRSRLRGLKFWKRKKEGLESVTPSP